MSSIANRLRCWAWGHAWEPCWRGSTDYVACRRCGIIRHRHAPR
jgi:hypothetical protein